MNLTHLFNKHASDKFTHGYGKFYEQHMPAKVNSLLEIGVLRGHSINAWKEAYPDAAIHGLDLFMENPVPTIEGVRFWKGNQLDYEVLENLRNNIKPQVIIDDGSHNCIDHWVTLFSLVPACEYYFIEDLHTCNEEFYRQGLKFEQTVLGAMVSGNFPFSYTLSQDQKIAIIRNLKS